MKIGRSFLVRSCFLTTLIKCLKGHKSLRLLCSVVKTLIVSGNRQSKQGTRSHIELDVGNQKCNLLRSIFKFL